MENSKEHDPMILDWDREVIARESQGSQSFIEGTTWGTVSAESGLHGGFYMVRVRGEQHRKSMRTGAVETTSFDTDFDARGFYRKNQALQFADLEKMRVADPKHWRGKIGFYQTHGYLAPDFLTEPSFHPVTARRAVKEGRFAVDAAQDWNGSVSAYAAKIGRDPIDAFRTLYVAGMVDGADPRQVAFFEPESYISTGHNRFDIHPERYAGLMKDAFESLPHSARDQRLFLKAVMESNAQGKLTSEAKIRCAAEIERFGEKLMHAGWGEVAGKAWVLSAKLTRGGILQGVTERATAQAEAMDLKLPSGPSLD